MKNSYATMVFLLGCSVGAGNALAATASNSPLISKPGEARGFNPQPDPPGRPDVALQAKKPTSPAEAQGFNPQPDPPGKPAVVVKKQLAPGEAQGFNPQPDPPGRPAAVQP